MFILRVSYTYTTQWPKGMVFSLHPAIWIFTQNDLVRSFCLCRSDHSSLRKPQNIPNLPSALCLDKQLEQAATKVSLAEAGMGLKLTGNREGRGTRFLQPNRCCGPVPAVEFNQPCWNPSAPVPPCSHTGETRMGQKDEEGAGLSGCKGQLLPVVQKAVADWCHSCQYCLMSLLTTWTMGWSTLCGNYTFQLV